MALSAHKIRKSRGVAIGQLRVPITTNATIYQGSLAARPNANGRASAATAATVRKILGMVVRLDGPNGPSTGTGVGNTAGTQYAVVEYGNEWSITVATAIRTNAALGLNVFVGSDDQVKGTAAGTAGVRVVVGELVDWDASDKSTGWVAVRRSGVAGNIAI